jgi:hypothetical protein
LLSAYQGFEQRVATFYDLTGVPNEPPWGALVAVPLFAVNVCEKFVDVVRWKDPLHSLQIMQGLDTLFGYQLLNRF